MKTGRDRVVIVGAGPVGLTAALALARRNIPTVVLAAEPELVMELRGSTFHPPTLDMLDEFGVVPSMIESGLCADLSVPRPRDRAGRDIRPVAPRLRHQSSLSRAMRAVEADAPVARRVSESPRH